MDFVDKLKKGIKITVDTTKNQIKNVGNTTKNQLKKVGSFLTSNETPADRAKKQAEQTASEIAKKTDADTVKNVVENSKTQTVTLPNGTQIPIRPSSKTEKDDNSDNNKNFASVENNNENNVETNPKVDSELVESTDLDSTPENKVENKPTENDTSNIIDSTINEVVSETDDPEKNEQLKEIVQKKAAPKVGRLKQALENKEITQEEYNHFVADRVLTAIGKALGFLVSRDPSWLFYKDQWQQRNENLLKEKFRVDKYKTTASLDNADKAAAQEEGDLKIITGDEAFVRNNPELYQKLQEESKTNEIAKTYMTEISELYAKNTEIDSQIKQLQTGIADDKTFNELLGNVRATYGGLSTTSNTDSTNDSTSTNKSNSKGTAHTAGGGAKGGIGIVGGNADYQYNNTKNEENGSATNKLTSKNNNKYFDSVFNMLQKYEGKYDLLRNSKQFNQLNENLIKGLREQKRINTSRIKQLEAKANKIGE